MIYELVLPSDTQIVHYECLCIDCNQVSEPDKLAILKVNKQIKAEVSAMFYSTRTFNILTGASLDCFMRPSGELHLMPGGFVLDSRAAIRFLEISFVPDYAQVPGDRHRERMSHWWAEGGFEEDGLTRRERTELIHTVDKERVKAVWNEAERYLHQFRSLEELTINIEQAYCPLGCCRMVRFLAKLIARFYRKRDGKIPQIHIEGELNHDEWGLMAFVVQTGWVMDPDSDEEVYSSESSDDDYDG